MNKLFGDTNLEAKIIGIQLDRYRDLFIETEIDCAIDNANTTNPNSIPNEASSTPTPFKHLQWHLNRPQHQHLNRPQHQHLRSPIPDQSQPTPTPAPQPTPTPIPQPTPTPDSGGGGGGNIGGSWSGCYFNGVPMWGSVYISSYEFLADFSVYLTSLEFLADFSIYETSFEFLASYAEYGTSLMSFWRFQCLLHFIGIL